MSAPKQGFSIGPGQQPLSPQGFVPASGKQAGPTVAEVHQSLQSYINHCERSLAAIQEQVWTLRRRNSALEAREKLRAQQREPAMPIVFRSQYGEDVLLWDFLGQPTTGFFIEVGAFDGVSYSVSFALEAMGWKGLLIEAIPDRFAACMAARPNSRVVHAALNKPGSPPEATFHFVQDQYGGMLSFLDPASDHAKDMKSQGVQIQSVKVPQKTMNELLADHTGPIDLAVIDVEGGEVDLLKGFDLERYKPKVLCLEDMGGEGSPLCKYMETQSYTKAFWFECNCIYVHNDAVGTVGKPF